MALASPALYPQVVLDNCAKVRAPEGRLEFSRWFASAASITTGKGQVCIPTLKGCEAPLPQVFLMKLHSAQSQELNVFLFERLLAMMLYLVCNVALNPAQLRRTHRKCYTAAHIIRDMAAI